MVYSFFSRWKSLKSEVFSLEKEIKLINIFYRLRVAFLQRVWDSLKKEKIDRRNAQRLLDIYRQDKYNCIYGLVSKKIIVVYGQHLLPDNEVYSFSELLGFLAEEKIKEKKIAEELLEKLLSGIIPEKSSFYALQDMLREEGIYLNQENVKFKALEDFFLLKKNPGAGAKGYYHLIDAVKKGFIKYSDEKLWYNNKPLQGIKIKDNLVLIKGDHYSSFQNARWIQGDKYIQASLEDPYSYFVERGKLSSLGPQQIQKILGISSAEAVVSLEIVVFPEQLFIKVGEKIPTHFAIAGLRQEQVKKVISAARKVA